MEASFHSPVAMVHDAARGRWLRFASPRRVIVARDVAGVASVLEAAEKALSAGRWVAGFLSYEASPAFDPALSTRPPDAFPPAWFLVCDPPDVVVCPRGPTTVRPLDWATELSRGDHREAVAAVRDAIARGDTYQVNLTHRLRAEFGDDPWPLFLQLVGAQGPGYAAYVDTGRWCVASASPELLIERQDDCLVSRPMKGTAARGRHVAEDDARREALRNSAKDHAENLMIVDMVRNDLGRIACPGSVAVPALYTPERYPTVWQLTSTVTCRSRAGLGEALAAVFPGASITGAPKARTMEIIRELECSPRRIYTGSIGFAAPDGRCQFNIAIRTVLVDRVRGLAEYGTGGGIVWDSQAQTEWDETRAKSRILRRGTPRFDLFETMLWTPENGVLLRGRHIGRLARSARYFGWRLPRRAIDRALDRTMAGLGCHPHRLRLMLGADASVRVTAAVHNGAIAGALSPPGTAGPSLRAVLDSNPSDPANRFRHHKTTRRHTYTDARSRHPDADDVLLWNADGTASEFTIGNLVIERDGALLTPPLDAGCLAGVWRAELLEQGIVTEAAIHTDGLPTCTRIFRINSVRGWQQVELRL